MKLLNKIEQYLQNAPFNQVSAKRLCADLNITPTVASEYVAVFKKRGNVTATKQGQLTIYKWHNN